MNVPIDRDEFVHELAMAVAKEYMHGRTQYKTGHSWGTYNPAELAALAVTSYKEALDYIDAHIVKEWVETN